MFGNFWASTGSIKTSNHTIQSKVIPEIKILLEEFKGKKYDDLTYWDIRLILAKENKIFITTSAVLNMDDPDEPLFMVNILNNNNVLFNNSNYNSSDKAYIHGIYYLLENSKLLLRKR